MSVVLEQLKQFRKRFRKLQKENRELRKEVYRLEGILLTQGIKK